MPELRAQVWHQISVGKVSRFLGVIQFLASLYFPLLNLARLKNSGTTGKQRSYLWDWKCRSLFFHLMFVSRRVSSVKFATYTSERLQLILKQQRGSFCLARVNNLNFCGKEEGAKNFAQVHFPTALKASPITKTKRTPTATRAERGSEILNLYFQGVAFQITYLYQIHECMSLQAKIFQKSILLINYSHKLYIYKVVHN